MWLENDKRKKKKKEEEMSKRWISSKQIEKHTTDEVGPIGLLYVCINNRLLDL